MSRPTRYEVHVESHSVVDINGDEHGNYKRYVVTGLDGEIVADFSTSLMADMLAEGFNRLLDENERLRIEVAVLKAEAKWAKDDCVKLRGMLATKEGGAK